MGVDERLRQVLSHVSGVCGMKLFMLMENTEHARPSPLWQGHRTLIVHRASTHSQARESAEQWYEFTKPLTVQMIATLYELHTVYVSRAQWIQSAR